MVSVLVVLWAACGGDSTSVADADADADTDSDSDSDSESDGLACPADDEWDPAWTALEDEVVTLLNDTRAAATDCGAGPVGPVGRLDPYQSLRAAARMHARDMAEQGFIGMRGSDGSTFLDRHRRCGYDGGGAQGADLATGEATAQDVLDRWLGTQTGCELVMDVRFEQVGVGYFPEGYWVVGYGEP